MAHERLVIDPDPCNLIVQNPLTRELLALDPASGAPGGLFGGPTISVSNPAIPTLPATLTISARYGGTFTNTDPCRSMLVQWFYRVNIDAYFINGNNIRFFNRLYLGTAPLPPLLFQEVGYGFRVTGGTPALVSGYKSDVSNIITPVITPGQTSHLDLEITVGAVTAYVANALNQVDINSVMFAHAIFI